MKLNFWQWLGVALLVVGGVVWMTKSKPTPAPSPAPATSQVQ